MAADTPVRADAVLVVHGTDHEGIVSRVAALLAEHGANIVALDQYSSDAAGGDFYQRTELHLPDFVAKREALEADLERVVAGELGLSWRLSDTSVPKRVAILASASDNTLLDLLWRQRRGEIPMTVPMVISNHTNVADDVRHLGIPFFHVPSVAGPDKSASEQEILKLLKGNVDLVVLARYMQILSDDFIQQVGVPVINIHHSFLPAFIGAGPYRRAKERGVKLVGATAHYVTADLDEGPIIEQDIVRVTHRDTVESLTRKGADVERQVLSRAVLWHCEDRVVRTPHNSTIVF